MLSGRVIYSVDGYGVGLEALAVSNTLCLPSILFFSDFYEQVSFFSAPIFIVLGINGGYWNIAHLLYEYEHHESGEFFVMQDTGYTMIPFP